MSLKRDRYGTELDMDSHQRRMLRREMQRLGLSGSPANKNAVKRALPEESLSGRLIDFFEHPWFLWVFGVLGGFVAGVIYAPAACLIVSVVVMGAFHRAKVVSGKAWRVQSVSYFVVLVIASTITYAAIYIVKKNVHVPAVARLSPKESVAMSAVSPELPTIGFEDDSDVVEASFGTMTGGNHVAMLKQMNGRPVYPIDYNGITPVQFQYLDGKVSYSVKFWSPNQQSTIEVTDGRFTVRNDSLDRNYSSRALEVVTRDGHPILQIIWLTPGHMRLNGLFPLPDGSALCMSDSGPKTVSANSPFSECHIPPVFKYPSWKYPGEFASPSLLVPAQLPASPGNVEIFFGAIRGEDVSFKTLGEMSKILNDTGIKSSSVSELLTIPNSATDATFTFSVRNTSNVPIKNATITVASNHMLGGAIGPGMRVLSHGEREYDISELKPYKQAGADVAITLDMSARVSSAFDPTRLLVTVDGDTMPHPHSEAVNLGFVPRPPE